MDCLKQLWSKMKEDPLTFIQWGLPPIMVIVNFFSDIGYIITQKQPLEDQNYYGLYCITCLFIPFLVYVFVFYQLMKYFIEVKISPHSSLQQKICQIVCSFIFCVFFVIPVAILCLSKIFFWTYYFKLDLKDIAAPFEILGQVAKPELYAEFYTNFQFVKDGICLYIQTMTIKFLGEWTDFTGFTLAFKILMLLLSVFSMARAFSKKTKNYQKIKELQKGNIV